MKRFLNRVSKDKSGYLISSEEELATIIEVTELPSEQVLWLFDHFSDINPTSQPLTNGNQFWTLMDRIDIHDAGLKKVIEELTFNIYKTDTETVPIRLADNVITKELQNLLFSVFDINNDGSLQFGELLIGFATLTTKKLHHRAAGLFHLYDHDKDGVVSKEDLLLTLRASAKSAKKILTASTKLLREDIGREKATLVAKQLDTIGERYFPSMVDEIFLKIGPADENHLSLGDFLDYTEQDPSVLHLFTQIAENYKFATIN